MRVHPCKGIKMTAGSLVSIPADGCDNQNYRSSLIMIQSVTCQSGLVTVPLTPIELSTPLGVVYRVYGTSYGSPDP